MPIIDGRVSVLLHIKSGEVVAILPLDGFARKDLPSLHPTHEVVITTKRQGLGKAHCK